MSNVSILEERNGSTLVNKSLDLGKKIENKKRWRIEKRMGRKRIYKERNEKVFDLDFHPNMDIMYI